MNKDDLEATVLLNTLEPRIDDMFFVNKDRGAPVNYRVWDIVNSIVDNKVPISTEFKRKVGRYYSELSSVTRKKRLNEWNKLNDYEANDDYYSKNRQSIIENYPVIISTLDLEAVRRGIGKTVSFKTDPAVDELAELVANISVDAAVAENEPEQLSPFEKFKDDLTELYLIRGYNQQLQNYVNGQLVGENAQKIEDFLRFARKSSKPVTVTDFEEYVAPAAVEEKNLEGVGALFEENVQPTGPIIAEPITTAAEPEPQVLFPEVLSSASDADLTNVQGDTQDAQGAQDTQGTQPEQKADQVPDGTVDRAYIKRYHETSLKLYFQNSSYPDWDHVLESNIMSLELSSFERIEMMEDVIKEYGTKLFITNRKSDTLEELNELVQLQFCILRNLHIGNRSKTASIKLSELTNLANAAVGAMPAAPLAQPMAQLTNEPRQQTRSEAQKNKDMDRLQHLKNLSLVPIVPKEAKSPLVKGFQDQHTLGIIPGNSANVKVSKGRTMRPGLVRLNKN